MNPLKRYYYEQYSFFNTGSPEKKVVTSWTQYQKRKPTDQEFLAWAKSPIQNWAIVCGEISNLIVFDVDTKNGADPEPFQNLGMYEVKTPSGGFHFYCKYTPVLANTKHKRGENEGILKFVDIQSNGAIVFAPPTKFANGAYEIVNDVPVGEVPEQLLLAVLEILQPEQHIEEPQRAPKVSKDFIDKHPRPGDIFNKLVSWDELLMPRGWTKLGTPLRDGRQMWRRPGKHQGISASTNYQENDKLYVFTSSTALTQNKSYTKFSFITELEYNGNYHEAAKQLKLINYKLIHNAYE